MKKVNALLLDLILTGTGVQPQIPAPANLTYNDPGFDPEIHLMIGQRAYNVDDNIVYMRTKTGIEKTGFLSDDERSRLMTLAEREKLSTVQAYANYYSHPLRHSLDVITETEHKKIMTLAERQKLENIGNFKVTELYVSKYEPTPDINIISGELIPGRTHLKIETDLGNIILQKSIINIPSFSTIDKIVNIDKDYELIIVLDRTGSGSFVKIYSYDYYLINSFEVATSVIYPNNSELGSIVYDNKHRIVVFEGQIITYFDLSGHVLAIYDVGEDIKKIKECFDGGLMVSTSTRLFKLNDSVELDVLFNEYTPDGYVSHIAEMNNGCFLVFDFGMTGNWNIKCLNADGTLNQGFNYIPKNNSSTSILVNSDDSFFIQLNGQEVKKYNSDGTLDNSFNHESFVIVCNISFIGDELWFGTANMPNSNLYRIDKNTGETISVIDGFYDWTYDCFETNQAILVNISDTDKGISVLNGDYDIIEGEKYIGDYLFNVIKALNPELEGIYPSTPEQKDLINLLKKQLQ